MNHAWTIQQKWSWSQPDECKHSDSEFPDTALEGEKYAMLQGEKICFPLHCQTVN